VLALTTVVSVMAELGWGFLSGTGRYRAFVGLRALPPVTIASAYAAMAATGALTVTAAACVGIGAYCAVAAAVLAWGMVSFPFQLPRLRKSWDSIWYGIRAYGGNVGVVTNARLDLLLMPAFLPAASVGLYSVASNLAWLVVSITAAIAPLAVPIAVRAGKNRLSAIRLPLACTILTGAAMAIIGEAAATPILRTIYGQEFVSAAGPLRILLPGTVAYAAAHIVWSGLYAGNRPFLPTLSQIPGVVITLLGLSLFLERFGISGAAVISTASYVTVFGMSMMFLSRASRVPLREFLPHRGDFLQFGRAVDSPTLESEADGLARPPRVSFVRSAALASQVDGGREQ
jgi:O-antigen/teichoic acid export membrane protein